MPTWMATLVIGGLSLVCNLAVTAYYYGKLAQTVADHGKSIEKLDNSKSQMCEAISQIRIDAARQQHGD